MISQSADLRPKLKRSRGFITTDVGRPLLNIRAPIEIPDLDSLVKKVMTTLRPISKELTDRDKNHYLVRILPYRTLYNKIDGAVIMFMPVASGSVGPATETR